jgi:hypothetical protein
MWSYKICCTVAKCIEIWNSWKVNLMAWREKKEARTKILITVMLAKINLRRTTNLGIIQ